MPTPVSYTQEDSIATVQLERSRKLNAVTLNMWDAVAEGIERAEEEEDVRAVILTGKGRMFCAGDDIRSLAEIENERDIRELADTVLGCFEVIEESSVPIIGKANGDAYGGGFELLIACDLTVVPEGATFALPETQIGAYPFYGAKRLASLIGKQRAADLALAGRELSAAKAVEWGLFARCVPEADLDSTVADIVADLQQSAPASLAITKAWLNTSLEFTGEDTGMRTGLGYLFAGNDASEGAEAFLEDREPDYTK